MEIINNYLINKIMNKEVKSTLRTLVIIVAFLWVATCICNAQEKSKINFTTQGDIVSSYVWRGMYQSGAAVQPTLGMSIGAFSLTAWGSVDLTGQGHKETDITASYVMKGVTLSLSDYWWAGQSGIYNDRENGNNQYFHLNNHHTDHILEAGISYTLPIEKMPLSFSWYTMFWGADKKTGNDGEMQNAYSSHGEVSYPFIVNNVNLIAALGVSPFESAANYKNKSFAVTNISLKASRDVFITDRFSLPLFSQIIWNPNREDVHLVFGITLK